MLNTLILTVNQLINMFSFIIIGFIFRKKKIGGEGVATALSSLLVDVFMPALVFSTFCENFRISSISENIVFLWYGMGVLLVTFFIAKFLSGKFAENQLQNDIYMYSFLIPNIGYMGYPLVEAVFGTSAFLKMLIFVIPYNIVIYTYGMYILNPRRELSLKRIFCPPIIALIAGIIAGLAEIKMPAVIDSIISSAKNCMAPSAMILTGFVLGKTPIKPLLKDIKLYFAAITRGILLPGVALGIMLLLKVPYQYIVITCVTLAMPMGLNSVVFPEAYGGDGLTGAKTSFVSNLLSIITIPLVFMVLGYFNVSF